MMGPRKARRIRRPLRREGGFAYIAAVLLLVVVAGLSAAIVRMNAAQQTTANDALLVTRAGQAARAGTEWMLYRLLKAGSAANIANACNAAAAGNKFTLNDFVADTGFRVTIACNASQNYIEGDNPANPGAYTKKAIYTLETVACNGAAATCPDDNSAASPDYAERRRVATMCLTDGGTPC